MKKCKLIGSLALGVLCSTFAMAVPAMAQDEVLRSGVTIDGMDFTGMTKDEITGKLEAYVTELGGTRISFVAANDNKVTHTLSEIGFRWTNSEVVDDALEVGNKGTVIQRYKMMKDVQQNGVNYELEYKYDVNAINKILVEECTKFDQKAQNASLKRENDQFVVEGGQTGYLLDVESSIDKVYEALNDWNGGELEVTLDVAVDKPQADSSELLEVKDVLGTFTTSFKTSAQGRSANVTNGCSLINGTTLYPGEEFSTYQTVSPFSAANGYYMAGSYLNGKVVDSMGGGICQVSTTLYNAVLLAELEVTERHNHSMIVSYVDPSADAAIAESAGKDFRFKNNLDYPIYIEGTTHDKMITFTIYGKETRDSGHEVIYESKTTETINPTVSYINASAAQPLGYVARNEAAHVGKKAQLWKIVKENGVEVSREQVNSSNYKMAPATYTVGVVTENPEAYNAIMAAIGTGNIDAVKATAAAYSQPAPAPAQ